MGLDPMRDIQVLSPSKKTDLGVWELNRMLQETLNPPQYDKPELSRGDTRFRLASLGNDAGMLGTLIPLLLE